MKYKIEIIADSMSELVTKLRITFGELASPKSIDFIKDIESKGMESVFFTEYANIFTVDPDKCEPDCRCPDWGPINGGIDCEVD